MDNVTIEHIRQLCLDRKIIWTDHVISRLIKRGISRNDIKSCIMNGEIIEDYPNDYPYPSCLVFGHAEATKIIHTVVGSNGENLWIITAYEPDPEKWDSTLKIRKENLHE